jgi:hypothetical protein
MVDFNLIPKDGQWSEERARTYFLQQIAKSLETITKQNKESERIHELLCKERSEHEIIRAALSLMVYKDEIKGIFEGKESLRLSDFRNTMIFKKERYLEYISRDSLIGAIAKTDYLDYEKTGNGFRVKLIR